ncbi:hypothetical protein FE257_001297 [Aspergillus nanangensis]|uniref:Uncharacterized protein n=1 Tax=Aspergillus nanangensis TaxID=2582783 RepID=A0AAD4CE16_ASPNN|nr:hypothetical protein FE257_001297 [Aspergillus nanangensis]
MSTQPNGRTHTRLTGTADYDEATFWDEKFANNQDVGEWLNSGDAIIAAAMSDLDHRGPVQENRPKVLHLGPGISKLGTKLRDSLITRGWAGNGIVNADFSTEAVRLGKISEREKPPSAAMHWVHVDLRSWTDVAGSLGPFAPFEIILDKSTSDAIATSGPATFSSAEPPHNNNNNNNNDNNHTICPTVREILDVHGNISLSPVELLALHLVPVTEKGTVWVTLSYSSTRFDNLPHLEAYWTVISRTSLKAPQGRTSSFAYAPDVSHWLYVLRRK